MSKTYDVAVVGATGAVGEVMLDILAQRNFPVGTVYALASERSVGKRVKFGDKSLTIENLATFDFSKVQIGLFSPGGAISREYAPIAASQGCVVIDNTSEFRYDDDIPLVAVSGSGKPAIEELAGQTAQLLNGKEAKVEVYPKQIAFNAIPQIDVNPTAVRIPVFYGHSEAVHIETRDKITAEYATELLQNTEGVEVIDQREDGGYPTAVSEGANNDPVYVGRIREDISHSNGLNMWVVADNVRKGAALNSIQIAEVLIRDYI
ncbi:Aspartate-semialdehyde dehydrogenase [Nymphon striatum]|nr:Aspartate-semialdehyde dehydrogenase [Nymphon striatum]